MELSIEYMLKWREDGARKAFSQWVADQQKRGDIPPEVAPLIRVEHDSARGDTELLAYLEGFVTTVQYLPDKPSFDVIKTGQYPHAIAQLQSLGDPKNGGWADKVRSLMPQQDSRRVLQGSRRGWAKEAARLACRADRPITVWQASRSRRGANAEADSDRLRLGDLNQR